MIALSLIFESGELGFSAVPLPDWLRWAGFSPRAFCGIVRFDPAGSAGKVSSMSFPGHCADYWQGMNNHATPCPISARNGMPPCSMLEFDACATGNFPGSIIEQKPEFNCDADSFALRKSGCHATRLASLFQGNTTGPASPASCPRHFLLLRNQTKLLTSERGTAIFSARFPKTARGEGIRFELVSGLMARGHIDRLVQSNHDVDSVSGTLLEPEPGRFFFHKQSLPGVAGELFGIVEFAASKRAYRIEPGHRR
jgi:hypothetical protein